MLLQELVGQNRSNLLKSSICDVYFEGIWVSKVKVGEEARIILTYSQPYLYTMRCTLIKVIDNFRLIVLEINSLKADAVG